MHKKQKYTAAFLQEIRLNLESNRTLMHSLFDILEINKLPSFTQTYVIWFELVTRKSE